MKAQLEYSYQNKRTKCEGIHPAAAATVLTPHWVIDLSPAFGVKSSFELRRNAVQPNQAFLLSHFVWLLLILHDYFFAKGSIPPVSQWPQLPMPAHSNPRQTVPELLPELFVSVVVQQDIEPHQVFPNLWTQQSYHPLHEVL